MHETENWWTRLTSEDRTDDEIQKSSFVVYTERLFKIKQRQTTIMREIKCGALHFFSCSFILAVNPTLLHYAGFSAERVAAGTAVAAGISCIFSGLLSNLPFILAPTTSTSLYFALFVQNQNLEPGDGNFSVFILGLLLFLCGYRPLAFFISNNIPFVMKVGICLGVGLLIALESLTEIGLVTKGDRTVLDIGTFDAEIYISMVAFVAIGLALHFKVRGAFLVGLVLGTSMYWLWLVSIGDYNHHITSEDAVINTSDLGIDFSGFTRTTVSKTMVYKLVFDLYIIGVILLNGLAHGLSEMAGVVRKDGTLPRGKWLYFSCGVGTLLASLLSCGPIMISPESAPGIKSGGRTGLSAVVCGVFFLFSTILCPLFAKIPASGTSPVLLMIGMMLFENAGKVNWASVKEALPVFLMCVFIPFTYSIFNGVVFGFGIYVILYFATSPRKLLVKVQMMCGCVDSADIDFGEIEARNNRLNRSFDSTRYSDYRQTLTFELNEIFTGGALQDTDGGANEDDTRDAVYRPLTSSAEDRYSGSIINHTGDVPRGERDSVEGSAIDHYPGSSSLSDYFVGGNSFDIGAGADGGGGAGGHSDYQPYSSSSRRNSSLSSSTAATMNVSSNSESNIEQHGGWGNASGCGSSNRTATYSSTARKTPAPHSRGPWGVSGLTMGESAAGSSNNTNTNDSSSSSSIASSRRSIGYGIGSLFSAQKTAEKPDWALDS